MEGSRSRPNCLGGMVSYFIVLAFLLMLVNRDWLWPAVWMLPENETYGRWPLSGEIDVRPLFREV